MNYQAILMDVYEAACRATYTPEWKKISNKMEAAGLKEISIEKN